MRATMLTLAMLWCAPAATQDVPSDPVFDAVQGYRIAHYRGVVPRAPDGVPRIENAEALALWKAHALFIDVMPAEGGIRDDATGRWSLAMPHDTIPRAHWFPEAGRGQLAPAIEPWFLGGVRRLARAHPGKPIVVFCLADCWMSWNAALRLRRAGLRDVRWFANGLDGWKEQGLASVAAVPM